MNNKNEFLHKQREKMYKQLQDTLEELQLIGYKVVRVETIHSDEYGDYNRFMLENEGGNNKQILMYYNDMPMEIIVIS